MEVQLLLFLTNMHMLYELFVNELEIDWFFKIKTWVPRKAQHIESYRRMMLLTSLLKKLILEN